MDFPLSCLLYYNKVWSIADSAIIPSIVNK